MAGAGRPFAAGRTLVTTHVEQLLQEEPGFLRIDGGVRLEHVAAVGLRLGGATVGGRESGHADGRQDRTDARRPAKGEGQSQHVPAGSSIAIRVSCSISLRSLAFDWVISVSRVRPSASKVLFGLKYSEDV